MKQLCKPNKLALQSTELILRPQLTWQKRSKKIRVWVIRYQIMKTHRRPKNFHVLCRIIMILQGPSHHMDQVTYNQLFLHLCLSILRTLSYSGLTNSQCRQYSQKRTKFSRQQTEAYQRRMNPPQLLHHLCVQGQSKLYQAHPTRHLQCNSISQPYSNLSITRFNRTSSLCHNSLNLASKMGNLFSSNSFSKSSNIMLFQM